MNKSLIEAGQPEQVKKADLLPSASLAQNPGLAVRCIRSHEDGLTKGRVYDAHKQGEWGYDVFPDDNGYLSGWDKRYFEVVKQ